MFHVCHCNFNNDLFLILHLMENMVIMRTDGCTSQQECTTNALFKLIITNWGTELTFNMSLLIYWALLRAFLLRLMMQFRSKELKFFETSYSQCRISDFPINSSDCFVKLCSWLVIFENFKNSSTSFSFEKESSCVHVNTII